MTVNDLVRRAPLFLACLAAASACSRDRTEPPSDPATAVRVKAEVFSLPHLFEVTLPGPDRWEAVTNARRLEFSPPAVLLLFAKREPALIRFSLYDSSGLTPRALLAEFRSQLETAGYRCRGALAASRDDDPVSLAFIGPQPESRRGKIFISRLPGNAALSAVAIGQWSAASDPAMAADFDAIVASLKAVR